MAARAKSSPPRSKPFPGYPPGALTWLRGIAAHNDRDWFAAHRESYEAEVKTPTVALAARLAARMAAFAPAYAPEDPLDAVLRIHRDLRFTEDKTPYKTEQALRFPYEGRGTRECAGFRIGVSARGVTLVGGAYAPGSATLRAIRRRIAEDHEDLVRILRRKALLDAMGTLRGHRTLRVPIGYDPEHPAGDLLRHRQLHLEATLPVRMATKPQLEKELLRRMKLLTPFVDLLNEAIDDA